MPRKPDPESPYRVSIHEARSYRYASTQPGTVNPATGKREYRRVHWGTVDENLRFHPNDKYRLASSEERAKLIFPADWDLSETAVQAGLPDDSVMVPEGQNENRLYGDSWLLMEIAKATGIFEDLCTVFRGNIEYVNIILTIAFFLIIEKDTYHNIEEWHNTRRIHMIKVLVQNLLQNLHKRLQNHIGWIFCNAEQQG